MLAIDIEYRKPLQRRISGDKSSWATYQVFRYTRVIGEDGAWHERVDGGDGPVTFHDETGIVSPEKVLTLNLEDFHSFGSANVPPLKLTISHEKLADLLTEAVEAQNDKDAGVQAEIDSEAAGQSWPRRVLTYNDNRKRSEEDDSFWTSSSSSKSSHSGDPTYEPDGSQ
jgi:hypothetical protein